MTSLVVTDINGDEVLHEQYEEYVPLPEPSQLWRWHLWKERTDLRPGEVYSVIRPGSGSQIILSMKPYSTHYFITIGECSELCHTSDLEVARLLAQDAPRRAAPGVLLSWKTKPADPAE